jgi:DNA-binding transcriptional regulator YiaG
MENTLNQFKEEIVKAHDELIDKYVEQIKGFYKGLNTKKKAILLGGIEVLLEATEMGEGIRMGSGFDNVRARKLREKTGLKQCELARKIGILNCYVCKYESGESSPTAKHTKEPARKYLAWLKEQGYDTEDLD